jgi:Sporulation and spore germination
MGGRMITRRTPRIGVGVIVAAVLAITLGACGIPSQDSAKQVDDDRVPYRLLDRNSGGIADAEGLGSRDAIIYLARGGRLIPTARSLAPPLTLPRLLLSLARGPTSPEVAAGIRTALPVEDAPKDVKVARGTATVDLPASFTNLSRPDQVLALAQIVYTVTGQPGIGQVQFTLDGTAADIPRADLSLTSTPVTRDDYLALAPPG